MFKDINILKSITHKEYNAIISIWHVLNSAAFQIPVDIYWQGSWWCVITYMCFMCLVYLTNNRVACQMSNVLFFNALLNAVERDKAYLTFLKAILKAFIKPLFVTRVQKWVLDTADLSTGSMRQCSYLMHEIFMLWALGIVWQWCVHLEGSWSGNTTFRHYFPRHNKCFCLR